jgi:siroheme synthase-like protein
MTATITTFTDAYPVVLRVEGRPVLVVGGGAVAAGKVRGLLAAGARVTVVAPDVHASMPDGVRIERRRYRRRDLRGQQLVFAATGDPGVNQRVFDQAGRRGLWVCSVDDPDRCSFALPAIHRDGPVVIAVTTGGASPTLAQAVRDRCVAAVPGDLGAVADELARARSEARDHHGTSEGLPWRPIVDDLLDAAATGAAPGRVDPPVPGGIPEAHAPRFGPPDTGHGAARTDDDRWLRTLAGVTA